MVQNKKPILAICIPSRNGGDVLVRNIQNILNIKDNRFIVHVNDNSSTDDTIEKLLELSNIDKRLIITTNETCVPAYINFEQVLNKAEAEYVYLMIDKESLKTEFLVDFLNFIENDKPYFGRVHLHPHINDKYIQCKKGVDAISRISHFGNTHTTGFYYRKDLYIQEMRYLSKKITGGSWWITDLVSLCLGFQYDAVIVNTPLNDFSYDVVLGGQSKTKHTSDTIYFHGKQRCNDYRIFLETILYKDNSTHNRQILYALNERYINLVTYYQKNYFSNKQRCQHYGVETRDVKVGEMLHWCNELYQIMSKTCVDNNVEPPKIQFACSSIKIVSKTILQDYPFLYEIVLRAFRCIKSLVSKENL